MTTTHADVLDALEKILEADAWPHTLYLSEEEYGEWVDDAVFNDPNQPSKTPTVNTVQIETDKEQRMVGEGSDGGHVVVYL